MKKGNVENVRNALPSLVANVGAYMKSLVNADKQKDTITNASGTLGFFISLFGKPLIDNYFEHRKEGRFADNGFNTYARAAFKQAQHSLGKVQLELDPLDMDVCAVALNVEKNFYESVEFLEDQHQAPIYHPRYHPVVLLVKDSISKSLQKLGLPKTHSFAFERDFNDNIEKAVEEEFGEDYDDFRKKMHKTWFAESEARLLLDQIKLSRIGFTEADRLKYEEAHGRWLPVFQKAARKKKETERDIANIEKELKPAEDLVEDFFNQQPESYLERILFVMADFGKGKSVFMRQYASKLAWQFTQTGEGYFPIYFNLQEFNRYNHDTQYGVLEDYLQTHYGIQLTAEYFKGRKYFFLVDSLDESCDLSKTALEHVLNSVRRIQTLDCLHSRYNKLAIATRPIGDHLLQHMQQNGPYLIRSEERNVGHYLSLYGFKKAQFNDWIHDALKNVAADIEIDATEGFVYDLIEAIKAGEKIDLYKTLMDNDTLSSSELRRPIFAYMIYQLIRNNINISRTGKIGIYLSFLNLLTKEAKYIREPGIMINLQEQFEARNILHEVAALWAFERQEGRQGFLKKADIYRVIGDYNKMMTDNEVLERYSREEGNEMQFISHSYFGENNNLMYFQHQSFAEILLAEYYIKVLVKCALDRHTKVEFAITKLKVGMPTSQAIEFLEDILLLLREASAVSGEQTVREKRKLLVPLLASISSTKNNKKLFSDNLYYQWYEKGEITPGTDEIPAALIDNWCITQDVLAKVIRLCEDIISSERISILSRSRTESSLIDGELIFLANNNYLETIYLDKFLALIAGNILYNKEGSYFIHRLSPVTVLDMLGHAEFTWLRKHFRGIRLTGETTPLVKGLELFSFDLTDAEFTGITIRNCLFQLCDFLNAVFSNVVFKESFFYHCKVHSIRVEGFIDVSGLMAYRTVTIPYQIRKAVSARYRDDILVPQPERSSFYDRTNIYDSEYSLGSVSPQYAEEVMKSFNFYLKYALIKGYVGREEILEALPVPGNSPATREMILEYIEKMLPSRGQGGGKNKK